MQGWDSTQSVFYIQQLIAADLDAGDIAQLHDHPRGLGGPAAGYCGSA